MNIPIDKLIKSQDNYDWYKKHGEGYRIVYFYSDDTYKIGTFCKNIEEFMMDFVEVEPIEDENDIPVFISIDDLLSRYLLDVKDACAVAIYKTDGTCICKKDRKNFTKNIH